MPGAAGSERVCVLYTGGTIGLRSLYPELHPDKKLLLTPRKMQDLMNKRAGLDVPFEFRPLHGSGSEGFTPIVSSKMVPADWSRIAQTIRDHYSDYSGFVVLHGTDTLAWTASALSFMFGNLAKPVVLTGAQRPINAAPSDAVSNFVNSVMLAAPSRSEIPVIPEVVVCFGDIVMRGNRSTKTSVASLQGFASPNAPQLGRVGRRVEIDAEQLRPAPSHGDAIYLRDRLEPRVADVVLYPGMPASLLRAVLKRSRGAVLRTFGAGNAPGGEDLESVLSEAAREGKVLVNVTQTNEGTVEAGMVTGTRALTDCGVLSGLDLTAEAALTKLMVLLGSEPPEVAAEQMQLDQRGELSMDLVELRAVGRWRRRQESSQVLLARALHSRVRSERLESAVLRVRSTGEQPATPPESVYFYLNHWQADRTTAQDARFAGRGLIGRPRRGGAGWDAVVDVTQQCRALIRPGAPVTLTTVWSGDSGMTFEVVLSLFMARSVGDD